MSGKVPLAAFCEEYDEDAHVILPETRQVAHRLSLKKPPIQIHHHSQPPSRNQTQNHNSADGASDSGYSSRTVTSSQSGPSSSGAKSPPLGSASTSDPTTTTAAAATTNKTLPPSLSSPSSSSSTTTAATTALVVPKKPKSSHKERRRRSTMQVGTGAYPSGPPGPYHGSSSSNRSPSRSRPKARQPGPWDYDSGVYHPSTGPSTPVDPLDYSYYLPPSDFAPTPPPPPPPLPPSSQTSRYSLPAPPPGAQDPLIVPHSSHPSGRSGRSNSYQLGSSNRPLSFHGMTPGGPGTGSGFYNPSSQWGRYEYGPPLSASAYSHSPSFGPTHFTQQPPFYSLADYGPPPLDQQQSQQQHQPHHHRERSMSRSRDYPKSRRGSMYGPPMVDNDPPTPTYDYDGEPLERGYSRDSRPPMSPSSSTFDYDEDYHRMPPPPLKTKSTNAAPRIIQKRPDLPRKSASTAVAQHRDHRQGSKSFDMAGMDLALPEQPPLRRPRYQRSRENLIPERSRSLRSSHRSSFRDSSALPARLAVEGARRRRAAFYHYDDGDVDDDVDDQDDHDDDDNDDEIVEKQREAEQYQAAKVAKNSSSNSSSNNKPTPLTEHALYKAKTSHRVDSDSGSQKSRSNSSRASDTRTHNGSNGGSNAVAVANAKQEEENKNITMTMNGVTMSFTQESVGGKKISLRAGDTGALELNIEGGKKPKKYLTSGSEYTGTVARRELEDARRPRDGRRSERASGRSSRSTYSGRFLA